MPKTKIISFVVLSEILRDAVRAEGYDSDNIHNNAPLWAEAVADINKWLADPAMILDDLSGDIDNGDSINDLFNEIYDPNNLDKLHVFIAPLEGGAAGIVRAKLAADLHTMNNDTIDPPAKSILFAWDGTKLVKINLDAHA